MPESFKETVNWFQSLPSLVAPDDHWTIGAAVAIGVALSIYLEQTYRWAAKISGPVLALVMAMLLSNLKILPYKAEIADLVDSYLIPVAIPLLLFKANVFHIIRTTGTMMIAFHVSVFGTVIGAIAASFMFQSAFDYVPGIAFDNVPGVAGIMTGSYSGGSVNFFAIKGDMNVSEDLTNPLLVADNFIMALMFMLLLGIAGNSWFTRTFPQAEGIDEDSNDGEPLAAKFWSRKEISLIDLAKSLAVAITIAAVACLYSAYLKEYLNTKGALYLSLASNKYVLITTLSTLVATLFHSRLEKINGSDELGAYMLYLFFFLIGLPADLAAVLLNAPLMFVFCLVMALVNLGVTLSLGKLLRLNLQELLICVNATLGGPPSAAGMAIAKGWHNLVLPALLVGIWGYVIGTPIGLAIGQLLAQMLSGSS